VQACSSQTLAVVDPASQNAHIPETQVFEAQSVSTEQVCPPQLVVPQDMQVPVQVLEAHSELDVHVFPSQ
jgi:hypothetical protein